MFSARNRYVYYVSFLEGYKTTHMQDPSNIHFKNAVMSESTGSFKCDGNLKSYSFHG